MANFLIEIEYYCILFILTSISTLLIRTFMNKTTNYHLNLPPSPPFLPFIGHLHLISSPLYLFFNELSTKYGPILFLQFGASRKLLVSSACVAAEIYKTHDLTFASRPPFVVDDEKLPYVGSSFMNAPYGEYWKFIKKLCMTKLFGLPALNSSRGIRREELHFFLKKMIDSASSKTPIDLGLELVKLTNNTVCQMVMSTRCSDKDDKADKCRMLVQETLDLAVKMSIGDVLSSFKWLGFWVYGKQAKDVFRRFDELIEDILKEHEDVIRGGKSRGETDDRKDLMDILLDIYFDNQAEFKLDRIQIKAFFLVYVFRTSLVLDFLHAVFS